MRLRILAAASLAVISLAYPVPARPSPALSESTSDAKPALEIKYRGPTTDLRTDLARAVKAANDDRFYEWLASLPPPTRARRPRTSEPVVGSGACGGDLPPCSVMLCESGGNLTAQNPRSTASGKWQILDTTWNGYGGYDRAADAPEDVQDARAREIYNGGAGRRAWVC